MTQAFECVCPLYPLAAEACPAHRARYVAQQHLRNQMRDRIASQVGPSSADDAMAAIFSSASFSPGGEPA